MRIAGEFLVPNIISREETIHEPHTLKGLNMFHTKAEQNI